ASGPEKIWLLAIRGRPLSSASRLKTSWALVSCPSNRSARATTRAEALLTKPLATEVPLPPQPSSPILTAELAWVPRTSEEFMTITPTPAALPARERNSRRPILARFLGFTPHASLYSSFFLLKILHLIWYLICV